MAVDEDRKIPTTPEAPNPASADLITLGRRIRWFRSRSELTLDALGAQVGTTASLLSLIENGKREPRLSLLQALAGALDVAVKIGRASCRERVSTIV